MADPVPIPEPGNTSPVPDKATKRGLPDFTGPDAPDRILHINLGFFKYGTNDKVHAAAVVFSLLLFTAIVGVLIFGLAATNAGWAEKAFNWLGSAFLFVAGVALGKGSSGNGKGHHDD